MDVEQPDGTRVSKRLRATQMRRVTALRVGDTAMVTGLAAEDPSNGAHGTVEAYDHVQRMFVLALQSRGAAEEGGEEAGEGSEEAAS